MRMTYFDNTQIQIKMIYLGIYIHLNITEIRSTVCIKQHFIEN